MDNRNETGRIEAFSDGVFAIAITLLVLDIKVPHDLPVRGGLATALFQLWPAFFAFVTSFATIGIMWINHHRLFNLIQRSDQTLLLLNSLLLLGVTFIPFPTALLAEYLLHPDGRTATCVYSGTFFFVAIVFNVLWRYASSHSRLLDERSDPASVQAISRQYAWGPIAYGIAFALAWVSVFASLALNFGLALFFALPARVPRSTPTA